MKPFAVVFAGVPGSSKSIIANYLSGTFGIPIFNNDQLRYEVKEDMLVGNLILEEDLLQLGINVPEALAEYEKRLKNRRLAILTSGRPIIFDGSVDRRWPENKQQITDHNYEWFMINMELSRIFLERLFKATRRSDFIPQLDIYFEHHQTFLAKFNQDIGVTITDDQFPNRMEVVSVALKNFIKSLEK